MWTAGMAGLGGSVGGVGALRAWLVAHDVHEARKHLNFSTWNQYNPKRQARKLNEAWEAVEEGEMPLWYYLAVHRDATLSAQDRGLLLTWKLGAPPE